MACAEKDESPEQCKTPDVRGIVKEVAMVVSNWKGPVQRRECRRNVILRDRCRHSRTEECVTFVTGQSSWWNVCVDSKIPHDGRQLRHPQDTRMECTLSPGAQSQRKSAILWSNMPFITEDDVKEAS